MSFKIKRLFVFALLLIGAALAGTGLSPDVLKHAIRISASAIWGS